ncbi:MAG TPA: FHA domain-containing protein [Firmicutes bacterium]|nr:FHA domain-containing protein [Bacillota bacterium]
MSQCPICETENSGNEEWCVECGWLLSQSAPGTQPDIETPIEDVLKFRAFIHLPDKGRMALRKARTVIGREFGDILISDDLNISRIHLALLAESGGLYVEDLRSSNGTLLNGVKIPPGRKYLLSDGDVITAGDSALKIEFRGDEKSMKGPGLYLVSEDGTRHRLRPGNNTVGRLPLNSINIESSPFVAREHAILSLEQTPSGLLFLYLTDLGSSNQSFINQKPVPAHTRIRVNPNDEVTFADVTYRVIEVTEEDD